MSGLNEAIKNSGELFESAYNNKEKASELKGNWYKKIKIPKRSGGMRTIEIPVDWLKSTQREIYDTVLLPFCKISKKAFGCVKGKGIVDAAREHVGMKAVLKLDLKDCFGSITDVMVYNALIKNDVPEHLAKSIAILCTDDSCVLPQGSPSSPSLANIVMCKMYGRLAAIARVNSPRSNPEQHIHFTGYLDDLIFSSNSKDRLSRMMYILRTVVEGADFKLNPKKIVLMTNKKEVLGCCVSPGKDHSRLPKKLRNKLRAMIHNLERDQEEGKLKRKTALFHHVNGLVSFAHQIGDQKSDHFKERMQTLGNKLTGDNHVESSGEVTQN